MNKYNFNKLERISKVKAKKLYNVGFDVLFIPCWNVWRSWKSGLKIGVLHQ